MKKIFVALSLCLIVFTANAQYENTTIKVGQKAPDLAFSDPNGKELKLSELNKHRIILLDFWASWCGPCRASSPGLVTMYNNYSNKKFKNAKKGFTVVSVSMDQDKQKWIDAIKHDNLTWDYHMSDLGGWQSKPALIYGVQYIPQCFLLDENGKVIGKYMHAEEAEQELQKMLK